MVAVSNSHRVRGEIRILDEPSETESGGKVGELAVVSHRDDEWSIRGLVHLIRGNRWMGIAHLAGDVACSHESRGLIDEGG